MPNPSINSNPLRMESLTSQVTQFLEQAILRGEIKPGEKLVERELSQVLGISRSPIREAIRSLESNGLVKTIPRKGTVVTEVSGKEVEEIYSVKSMLEGFAARLACKRITGREIREFRLLLEKMENRVSRNNLHEYLELSKEFHELIIKASNNAKLYQIYRNLMKPIQWLQLISLSFPERARNSLREHQQIVEAFVRGDGESLEKVVREHVDRAGRVLLQNLDSRGSTGMDSRAFDGNNS